MKGLRDVEGRTKGSRGIWKEHGREGKGRTEGYGKKEDKEYGIWNKGKQEMARIGRVEKKSFCGGPELKRKDKRGGQDVKAGSARLCRQCICFRRVASGGKLKFPNS